MDFIAEARRVLEAGRGKVIRDSYNGRSGEIERIGASIDLIVEDQTERVCITAHGKNDTFAVLSYAYLHRGEAPELAVERAIAALAAIPTADDTLRTLAQTLGIDPPANDAVLTAEVA